MSFVLEENHSTHLVCRQNFLFQLLNFFRALGIITLYVIYVFINVAEGPASKDNLGEMSRLVSSLTSSIRSDSFQNQIFPFR